MDFSDADAAALGQLLAQDREGSIHDLNDLPPEVLAALRALGDRTILRYKLMRFLTVDSLRGELQNFCEDVACRGEDPRVWRRGGILYPHIPLDRLVTSSVPEILSVLAPREDERWLQIAPTRDMWEIGEDASGAPALERPELRYDSATPDRAIRVLLNGLEDLREVDDIEVATRRWMGSRIAWHASKAALLADFDDGAALVRALLPAGEDPSDDAAIAAGGVIREMRTASPGAGFLPGFSGPVAWFT